MPQYAVELRATVLVTARSQSEALDVAYSALWPADEAPRGMSLSSGFALTRRQLLKLKGDCLVMDLTE